MHPKAKLQNAATFTRNGSHSHVSTMTYIDAYINFISVTCSPHSAKTTIGRYQRTNRPIPIIGKTVDTSYQPIIAASLVDKVHSLCTPLHGHRGSIRACKTHHVVYAVSDCHSSPKNIQCFSPYLCCTQFVNQHNLQNALHNFKIVQVQFANF